MKTRFKNQIQIQLVVLLFISISMYSQVPSVVSAPQLEAQTAQNLVKTTQLINTSSSTLTEAKKTAKALKDALEAVEKVSQYLFDAADTYEILRLQSESLHKCVSMLSNTANRFNELPPKSIVIMIKGLNTMVKELKKQAVLTKKLLTSGVFKMSDAERLTFLMKLKEDAQLANTDITEFERELIDMNKRYEKINKQLNK